MTRTFRIDVNQKKKKKKTPRKVDITEIVREKSMDFWGCFVIIKGRRTEVFERKITFWRGDLCGKVILITFCRWSKIKKFKRN